jgi:gamma-glutamyl phosphate reductase
VETLSKDGVTFRVDEKAAACLPDPLPAGVELAGVNDFDTEWLSLVLGIKVVDTLMKPSNISAFTPQPIRMGF